MIGNKYSFLCRLIKLQALTIPHQSQRRQWRRDRMEAILNKTISSYRWGVSYSVFDCLELLEASIRSIREHVNYINVVYQTESWFGVPAAKDLLPMLERLTKVGLIDELIEYKANPKINAGVQECKKRNIGLRAARRAGVNYFMTMDADEFYNGMEFESAKKNIIRQGITHSFCGITQYGVMPTKQIIASPPSFVHFMSKIGCFSHLNKNSKTICLTDPSRRLSRCSLFCNKYYFLSGIQMHHYTYIRKNIVGKMRNSSAESNHNVNVKNLSNIETSTVPDAFNLMPIVVQFNKENKDDK